MHTTYHVKGKLIGIEFLFQYDLNGNLLRFEVVGKPLNAEQKKWLFLQSRFPADEENLKHWQASPHFNKKFKIERIPPDLSFDNFWATYGKHGTKSVAKKKFDRLKEHEVIKAFLHIAEEQKKKKLDGTPMPYAETYLNQKRWEV